MDVGRTVERLLARAMRLGCEGEDEIKVDDGECGRTRVCTPVCI